LTTDEFLALLANLKATWHDPPRRFSHTVIRPRQEITDAMLRWQQQQVGSYAPELVNLKLAILYEYAAQYMLRDTVLDPNALADDLRQYLHHHSTWWEEWRKP
jgi:hypothetical protein